MEEFKVCIPIGPGFWNIRGTFRSFKGLVDIGTHMSLAQLSNGNFLVIDAVQLTDEIKGEIDKLTDKGTKIEAVVATHPFHTLAITPFHQAYPNAPMYGCPRHIRKFPEIKWAGDLNDCNVRNKWNPDIEIRIPAGAEFVAPLPEKTNHFSCAFVFHRGSKTLHVDDTIMYSFNPGFLLKLAGFKHGNMCFHISIKGPGLLPHPEAPFQFRDWLLKVIEDWHFDNLCTAHFGNKIGGARDQVAELVKNSEKTFQKLSDKKKNGKYPKEVENVNVDGDECG